MPLRTVIGVAITLALLMLPTLWLRASDRTMLIELEARAPFSISGVSASGAVVVGGLIDGGGLYWMPTTGTIFNGGLGASDVSRDGRTIVGTARDTRGIQNAAIWVRGTEWRLLGSFGANAASCDALLSSGNGVSRDGQVVVGLAYNGCTVAHAFRWQESTGMVDLGSTVAGQSSLATDVSGDGSVVVGYQVDATGFRRGARWVNGRQELIPGVDGFVGTATAANHDGAIVLGRQCRPTLGSVDQNAWKWGPQSGTECLPAPQRITVPGPGPGPIIQVQANATSDDGRVIGGEQNIGGSADSNAVIWIDGRAAYLKDFLRANGIPNAFETWINTGAITGVSPDGRVIVGWGAARLGFRGYMVILGSSLTIP